MTTAATGTPPRDLPKVIGSYRVVGEREPGRLGRVLDARDRVTGRAVELTVLKPEWACLPRYVARLLRHAHAAAPLSHPNLLALREFGESQGRVFFAAEPAPGPSLAAKVTRQGALAPREAVAAVLQAARGLQYAHGQGVTHGDVTAADLYVGDDGLLKVGGLGLVKTPAGVAAEDAGAETGPIALGAPPPEVAAAAAAVRADVRGLGRTLIHLITGRPPEGPDEAAGLVARGVPANLVELVRPMLDPRPESGHADLGPVVTALERLLNARGGAGTTPKAEHTQALTDALAAFRAAPAAVLRRRVVLGAVAACAGLVLLCLVAFRPLAALSWLGLGVMTGLVYHILTGPSRQPEVFAEARGLVVESKSGDWLLAGAALLVFLTALAALGLHWPWLFLAALAAGLAAGLHFGLDRRADAEQAPALAAARGVVAELRRLGVGEDAVRRFVRGTAGEGWEEPYEALFGYDAMRAAREPSEQGLSGLLRLRHRHGRWRDPLVDRVVSVREARRRDREAALLQAVEERGLVAEGVNLLTARRKSRRTAEAMAAVAAELRAAARGGRPPEGPGGAPPPHETVAGAVRKAAEAPEEVLAERETGLIGRDPSWIVGLLTGARVRFLLGSALLAGFLAWVHQNGIVREDQLRQAADRVAGSADPLKELRDVRIDVNVPRATKPLALPGLPGPITRLFNGFGPGAAGLILVLSCLLGGSRVGWFAIPGAALALFGAGLGVPHLGPLDPTAASAALGAALAVIALPLGRAPGE